MEYVSLDPTQKQIRLLHLHAGKPEDEITSHFSIISLDNHETEYEALSYVWGDTTEGYYVLVERVQMPVTDNLWQALSGLRHPHKQRKLWVDALCINQNDDKERSDQVSHMNAIYTYASTVEIWLGDAYEGIEIALKFIREFSTGLTTEGTVMPYTHLENAVLEDWDTDASDVESEESNSEVRTLMHAMREFARKPWFERVWTVQEFFLAERSTFYCGAHTLDGAVLKQALWHLTKHNKWCCALSMSVELQMALNTLFLSSQALRQLKMVRLSFLECVSGFRFRKATDPRDKIYGLMGLGIGGVTDIIHPDYTLPVEKVFEDFVIALLHQTRNLDVLSHLQNGRQQDLTLPSFVPDWSMDLNDMDEREIGSWSIRCSILDIYDAAQGTTVEYEASPGILRIRGSIVDTVKTIANGTLDDTTDGVDASHLREFLDEAMQIANIPPKEKDPRLAKREEFWLVMIAGSEPEARDVPSNFTDVQPVQRVSDMWDHATGLETDYHEGYEDLIRTSDPDTISGNSLPQDFYLFDHALAVAQRGRKFVVTEHGRMGLVPRHAREGDVVAILTGASVPIILRPAENFFTVVGDAYVHGIMDGEAVEDIEEPEWIELH